MSPAVYRVVHQRLALSGLRLGLAAVAAAGSIAAGAEFRGAAVGLALGAAICGLALVTDRRWLLLGKASAEPLPDGVRSAPLVRSVADGMLPILPRQRRCSRRADLTASAWTTSRVMPASTRR